ncbi:hypothetical protein CFC21_107875 [Triticum aestivum]|uniref:Uncharacterized protein n=2 Tax=Triticum aestivum TaxID=4565 RepID=A0A9R1MHP0_WHEAT|nr:uncharacterized protein LOC123165869 isoform X1 [Triticum aestivum]KAF7107214.1 hypothetical protein CFC21_107875 [Triticum aestivum]
MPVVRESGAARGCWARKGEEQSRLRCGVSKRRAQRGIVAAVAGKGVAATCPRISAMAPARESLGARGCVARRERAAADLTPPPSAAASLQRRHVVEVNQKVDDALPLAAELLVDVDAVFFPAMCRRGTARRESPMARCCNQMVEPRIPTPPSTTTATTLRVPTTTWRPPMTRSS